jgi:hypothetical protein
LFHSLVHLHYGTTPQPRYIIALQHEVTLLAIPTTHRGTFSDSPSSSSWFNRDRDTLKPSARSKCGWKGEGWTSGGVIGALYVPAKQNVQKITVMVSILCLQIIMSGFILFY